jgi:hypothetical protein
MKYPISGWSPVFSLLWLLNTYVHS